jgi:hypothetical protein
MRRDRLNFYVYRRILQIRYRKLFLAFIFSLKVVCNEKEGGQESGKRLQYTVKNFYEIPGLFLIKSSWDCVKYFQRLNFTVNVVIFLDSYFPFYGCKTSPLYGQEFCCPLSERLNSRLSWFVTYPGIFLAADSESFIFAVVLDFYHQNPYQT